MSYKIPAKAGLLLAFLPLIYLSYIATLWLTPYYVQYKFSKARKFKPNTVNFRTKPTGKSPKVVPLPNPDFLYSNINFDVSDSILKISGLVPDSTYWSISGYKANTTNFFVINDTAVSGEFEYYLVKKNAASLKLAQIPQEKIIYSPTNTGVILFRNLISKAYSTERLTEIQKTVKTETISYQ